MNDHEVDTVDLPDAEAYVTALQAVASDMTAKQRALLVAHYLEPEHTASARRLAELVGWSRPSAVNLQYGILGGRLREALHFYGAGQKSFVIASFLPPGAEAGAEWLWVMHAQVVTALETLGWVGPSRT